MECFQLMGNMPEFRESVKRLSNSKGKSGPQLTMAVGGIPSGPWWIPGLKLAKQRAIVLASNDTVDKVGLILFCG